MNIPIKNNFKSNQLYNKQLQSNTDDKQFHLNASSKEETLTKKDSEVSVPVHAVNPTRTSKTNQNTQVEPENHRAESTIKKTHLKTRGDISNLIMTVESSLEKHFPKPPTKAELELLLQPAVKDEIPAECKTDIPPHVYAEVNKPRKIQHNLQSQTDPEDGLVTCHANNNQSPSKGMPFRVISSIEQPRDRCHFTKPITMKTDSKVQVHTELKNESAFETDSTKTPPFYSEINKEQKLKHRMQVHPKHELLTGTAKSSCIEPRDQPTIKDNAGSVVPTYSQPNKDRKLKDTLRSHTEHNDVITTSGTKEYHDEVKRTSMQIVSLLTLREEKSGRRTPSHSENIYEEPEDIHTASPKLVTRSHPIMKSDTVVPVYAEPTNETVPTIKQYPYSNYMTDNDLYATLNNEFDKPEDSEQNCILGKLDSLMTEELQCEMDFYDEAIDEFECENGLYGSPQELLNTPTDFKAKSNDKRSNDALCKNWKRQFQFPPPPIDDAPIYAEPNVPVAENVRGSRGSVDKFNNKPTEYEMENELYAESNNIQKNNYEYPEYEEPEIICDDVAVETSKLDKKAEEVEYSCIPETDNKTEHYYNRPFKTDDFHVYEDPEECQIETKQEKPDNTKAKKKNTRQKSDPCTKSEPSGKTEETKKGDHFIHKIFKQATRKNSDKSDKGGDVLLGGNVDETLVMLTDIQQILEKKKRMIKAMAQQEREVEARRTHSKSKSADLACRSKSYPSRSPDLLKDLSEHVGFRGLEDEYATVCDVLKENIYSEVVNDNKFERKQRHPIGTGKYGTWAHGKEASHIQIFSPKQGAYATIGNVRSQPVLHHRKYLKEGRFPHSHTVLYTRHGLGGLEFELFAQLCKRKVRGARDSSVSALRPPGADPNTLGSRFAAFNRNIFAQNYTMFLQMLL
ncbi:hypothetical protein WA026_000081 [Henosepilachna vigintioctopunctata]|uniref:Uncharacterized protein n=1 Tax=Henosepilachna vigintioctopunctata TaxID=420089 RepID=A0AAW1V408_9CUCU